MNPYRTRVLASTILKSEEKEIQRKLQVRKYPFPCSIGRMLSGRQAPVANGDSCIRLPNMRLHKRTRDIDLRLQMVLFDDTTTIGTDSFVLCGGGGGGGLCVCVCVCVACIL